MAKKKRKLDPNRFQQQDDKGLFSFDPIRRNTFKWGLAAGAIGGLLMVQVGTIWQILGVFAVVFISNYQIAQAAKRILVGMPRLSRWPEQWSPCLPSSRW